LSAYVSHDDRYRAARRDLLDKFAGTRNPQIAERVGRACLLHPVEGDELRKAVALAQFAASADRSQAPGLYPFLQFVGGLADYRQGKFARAITVMQGDASGVLGPAPRLVVAMALHKSGQAPAARKALTSAVAGYDWRSASTTDQDGFIYHVLRREAERMILPAVSAFQDGKYQPKDNDERLTFIGISQSMERHATVARLYAAAEADAPPGAQGFSTNQRYYAARAAAQAGCGLGTDAASVDGPERDHWRKQALVWLRAELADWVAILDRNDAARRGDLRQVLSAWQHEPYLACVREPNELKKLAANEQKEYVAFWAEVAAALTRAEK
jgi:serine/threonine-protein kinase